MEFITIKSYDQLKFRINKETIENYIKTISKKCLTKKQNRFFITQVLFFETDEVN